MFDGLFDFPVLKTGLLPITIFGRSELKGVHVSARYNRI